MLSHSSVAPVALMLAHTSEQHVMEPGSNGGTGAGDGAADGGGN